jgi:hypothetical protein
VLVAGLCLAVAAAAAEAHFDHPVPTFAPQGPLSTAINAGGENADWELITTIPTGNPHTDLDFFTKEGETYLSAGTLASGPNAGGQTIVKLTENGEVAPEYITGHPSASCLSVATGVTGLQHDVEATPKGDVLLNAPNAFADEREAQLLVDATDASGRCHDQGSLGLQAPRGGLEIIDITDPSQPKEIALTSHIGEAHTVNVDPKRPHIAFVSSSDGTTIGSDGRRANESPGSTGPNFALDGFEVVDMSSCMNFPAGTSTDDKRTACQPVVYRYRWPSADIATASSFPNNLSGCHEIEVYADDRLTCASITATLLFDISGAFDDRGTPGDYSDDKPRGTPLPCRVRASSNTVPAFATGAMVTDCVSGGTDAQPQPLEVAEWMEIGSPSLEGVERIGSIHHMGFQSQQQQSVAPPFDATEDVFVSHEAELTGSGRHLLVTDERGGGVIPGGATCSPGADNVDGNGGISAYPVSRVRTTKPASPEEAQQAYAQTSEGERAVYRAPVRTGPQGSFCTSHVFQQIPGQNRIFMGWYSQGTQVVDFVERGDGTIDFKDAAHFIPENANTWTSAIFKVERSPEGGFTYYGATGDFALAGTGRNAIDIYKVTLPPPPEPAGGSSVVYPAGASACTASNTLLAANARPRRRGLRFTFRRAAAGRVTVKLIRQSVGRRIRRQRRVKRFRGRSRSFNWSGRGRRLRDGYYVARFTTRAPNGKREARNVALRRADGRFRRLGRVERVRPCTLLSLYRLGSSVWGSQRALKIAFRLRESSSVRIDISHRGRRVKRFRGTYAAGRTHRLEFGRRRAKLGDYRVTLRARHPGKTSQSSLVSRRLR